MLDVTQNKPVKRSVGLGKLAATSILALRLLARGAEQPKDASSLVPSADLASKPVPTNLVASAAPLTSSLANPEVATVVSNQTAVLAELRAMRDQLAVLNKELADVKARVSEPPPLPPLERLKKNAWKVLEDHWVEIGLGFGAAVAAVWGYLRNTHRFMYSPQFMDLAIPKRPLSEQELKGRPGNCPTVLAEYERFGPRSVEQEDLIDELLGGPTQGLAGILFRRFSPRANAFLVAQDRAQETGNLPFLRIRTPWGVSTKIASTVSAKLLSQSLVEEYLDRSFLHLKQEIERLDPGVKLSNEVLANGAPRIYATATYEGEDEIKNRLILTSGLAACAQLANPCRWLDGALRRGEDHKEAEPRRVVRQMEIATALALNVKNLIDLHIPKEAVNTRAMIERNISALSPMLLLTEEPSLRYLCELGLHQEELGNVIELPAEDRAKLRRQKEQLVEIMSNNGAPESNRSRIELCHTNLNRGKSRIILNDAEQAKLDELWYHNPSRTDRALAGLLQAIKPVTSRKLAARIDRFRDALLAMKRPYVFFKTVDG